MTGTDIIINFGPYVVAAGTSFISWASAKRSSREEAEKKAEEAKASFEKSIEKQVSDLKQERSVTKQQRDYEHQTVLNEIDMLKENKNKSEEKIDKLSEGLQNLALKMTENFAVLGTKIDALKPDGKSSRQEN